MIKFSVPKISYSSLERTKSKVVEYILELEKFLRECSDLIKESVRNLMVIFFKDFSILREYDQMIFKYSIHFL